MKKDSLYIALAMMFFSMAAFGQQTAPTPPATSDDGDVVRISTTLIQLDVTVTDKKGNIVKDLKPEEFEIYENQNKQTLTNFSFVQPEAAAANAADSTAVKSSAKENKSAVSIPLPPAKLKLENVRRTIAFVIDDLSLEPDGVYFTQKALKNFVDNQMQDGDLIAIIRTSAGIGTLQQFSSDKRQLYAAIKNIRWSLIGKHQITLSPFQLSPGTQYSGGEKDLKDAEDEYDDYQRSVLTAGTLGASNYVINGMKNLPGRKSIMFISNRLSLKRRDGQTDERAAKALRGVIEAANRASIVIYTMNEQGIPFNEPGSDAEDDSYPSPELADDADLSPLQNNLEQRNKRVLEEVEKREGLKQLAVETGGLAMMNRKDSNFNIQRMLNDQNGYYLIGYQPDSETFDPKKLRFNKLIVKVNRPGVFVRYRSGFFGVENKKETAANQLPSQRLDDALTSPFAKNDVNVHLAALFGNEAKGSFVRVFLYIRTKDITFSDEPDGWKKATFDIAVLASSEDGAPLLQLGKKSDYRVSLEDYQKIVSNGFVYNFNVLVKKPGAYQLHIAVQDDASEKIGSANQFIEVPNLAKNRLALSGITLGNFTPEEWQRIQSSADSNDPAKAKNDTAVRSFKHGSVLSFSYTAYDAALDKLTKQPNLQTHFRLLRDGKVVLEGDPKPVSLEGEKDMARIRINSAILLGNQMPEGEYILQVITDDASVKGKNSIASQWIDFDVAN